MKNKYFVLQWSRYDLIRTGNQTESNKRSARIVDSLNIVYLWSREEMEATKEQLSASDQRQRGAVPTKYR